MCILSELIYPLHMIKKRINKVYQDGSKFDSKLELYAYNALKDAGLPFTFQSKYTLLKGFKYNGAAIRDMTLTVDFDLPSMNIIIDTKGYQREDNKLKWKLLKGKLTNEGKQPAIYFPTSRVAVDELIAKLKTI